MEISLWYKKSTLGNICCGIDLTRCPECKPSGNCDSCDTLDGRDMQVVSEYASSCDGCGELTMHELQTMDKETQLGYCEQCCRKMGMKWKYDKEAL
jgi:hypothetical protein